MGNSVLLTEPGLLFISDWLQVLAILLHSFPEQIAPSICEETVCSPTVMYQNLHMLKSFESNCSICMQPTFILPDAFNRL